MQREWTTGEVAGRLGGSVLGDAGALLTGAASVDEAEPGDLVFAESEKFLAVALKSRATAALVPAQLAAENASKPLIVVENARLSFVRFLELLSPPLDMPPGIHPTAQVSDTAVLGAEVRVGANATIGAGAQLGARVVVMAGAHIGANCTVGDGTILYPNVVLYPGTKVGRGCLLHAGCVLGADGYGYVPVGHSLKKIPHLGSVEVGDEVEIGANTCIDRAKTGITVIGSGTKIDNLVHIAHNCRIGMSCLIISQTGVAGSVEVGNGVILAGQAGIKDHVTIGDGARVGAQGGVIGDIPPGVTVSGYPARPHAEKMREYAAMASLPDYLKRIRALEKRLAELEAQTQKAEK